MNSESIIEELARLYPGKKIFCNKIQDKITEIICEIEPTSEHKEYSIALSVIDRSVPHFHKETIEEYAVIKGELTLFVDGIPTILKEGDSFTIPRNIIHWARGNSTWIKATSHPGWTPNDHKKIEPAKFKNEEYWVSVNPEQIPSGDRVPGKELLTVIPQNAHILDIGCGSGKFAKFLSAKGHILTGIDINSEAIKTCQQLLPSQNFLSANLYEPLPFEDDSFDCVLSGFVFTSIIPKKSREFLVGEICRVLKPNGIFWIHDALISDSYKERYDICFPFVSDENDFFSFKDKNIASNIKACSQLRKAIDQNLIERTAHHFSKKEILKLFQNFKLLVWQNIDIKSPRTNSELKSAICVFRKTKN